MSFQRPSLQELIAQAEAEVSTRLGIGPLLRRGVLRVLARVMAGLSHSSHGHLDYLSRQILPTTAAVEYLERHAELRGITRKPAAFARGLVSFTGTDGATVPAGTRVQRSDGRAFALADDVQVFAGEGSGEVEDTEPGAMGDTAAGTELLLVSPVQDIDASATSGAIAGGAEPESDAALRARVLAAWRQQPRIGTEDDYEAWALEVPGITRAFSRGRWPSLGFVTVYVLADEASTGPLPTDDQIADVQAAIDAVRPIVATVNVEAPVLRPVDFSIQLTPAAAATQADAEAGIAELIRDEIRPGGTLRLSRVSETISAAAGEVHHQIVAPAADVRTEPDEVLTLGVVTWS